MSDIEKEPEQLSNLDYVDEDSHYLPDFVDAEDVNQLNFVVHVDDSVGWRGLVVLAEKVRGELVGGT